MYDENEIEVALKNSLGMPSTSGARATSWTGSLHSDLTHRIIGAAIEVHRHIGPGKLESIYQHSLERELAAREIPFRAQAPVAMLYKGKNVGDFVLDFIVDERVIVELKAVHRIESVHISQTVSYLRATGLRLALLINFNEAVLVHGVRRLIISRTST